MKEKKINGYTVHEPKVGDAPELFALVTGAGESTDMSPMINSLLRNCVFLDGQPLGDRLRDVPIRDLKPLIDELVSMAGLLEKK